MTRCGKEATILITSGDTPTDFKEIKEYEPNLLGSEEGVKAAFYIKDGM